MDYSVVDQEADIQREIELASPMFSQVLGIDELEREYSTNPNFLRKLPSLHASYPHFRRTRGDGNCFYRCVMFSLLEQFILTSSQLSSQSSSTTIYHQVLKLVKESGSILSAAGFEPICYEDFIDLLVSKLESVQATSIESLQSDFEDKMIADSLVMYSRFLISAYMRLNNEKFEGFTEGYATVLDYCKSEVEPMDRESEQLQVMAVAEAFGVRIKILYLDRSDKDQCTEIEFPVDYSGPDFSIYLLYRPGHYDLLYPIKKN
jgi:ubiquitin thioesterase protein OTUB1